MRESTQRKNWAFWLLALVGMIGLGMGMPKVASSQINPPQSTAQKAELEEAKRLNQQAAQLYQQGQYSVATPLAERVLAIYEKALGPEHLLVATSLNNLAGLYREQGNYPKAEPLYQRSLGILEKALGPEHPDVAQSLNNLAELYRAQGNYPKAEPLYQRSLAILEKALGPEHPDVATSLNNLAGLYREQGNYSKVEPLYQWSLAIREKVLGPEHPSVASSLNNLAELYRAQGNYAKAEPLHQRSLAIREKALGPEHPDVASSLNNLADLYRVQGNYAKAEPLYQRSLAIREKALGPEHPDVATSLNNLAGLYRVQGNYPKVEPLYQRSLAISEKALGPEHPDVASSLNNLALLYQAQGNYPKAEPLYQQSLAISEKALGPEHPDVAQSLNNLAGLYLVQGNYPKAEPLYQRSLAIREKVLRPEHPSVATSLNNLALLYRAQGNDPKAEPLYRRSLAIYEKALGPEHPSVATSLNNLALLYKAQGNYPKAEPLYQRSLAIYEKALGPEHPSVANSLNNLAELYWASGDMARAIAFQTRGNKIAEHNLTINLTTGSEAEKRAYIHTISGETDFTISMHVQGAPNNPQAARLALTTILQRKGRVLDALTDIYSTLRQHLKPEDQALLNQLSATRSQLSALASKDRPSSTSRDEYRRQLTALDEQAQELEATLSRHSEEFRSQTQPATIEAVQPLIPADAALVELEEYPPFNPKTNKWGTPRYVAYILHRTGDPQWVDLGEAQAINQAVANFRHTVRDQAQSPAQVKQVARTLDALLMQPIRQDLGNSRHLLISPDSQLSLVPFAALADQQNQYLVENYLITYLSSGRDLLKLQIHAQSQLPPVLVANPDFDHPGNKVVVQSPTRIRGTGNERSLELADVRFDSLSGLAQEAKAIAPLLPKVILLTGADATKSALKQLHGPNILHIATHGFFLTDEPRPKPEPVRGLSALGERGFSKAIATLQNPLLRSGLALAGANLRKDGNDQGLLTALEAADLDLRGTKLLVLSACDTGLGDVVNGEGVYGLRRAFAIAGTETQVISLWSAFDQTTKDQMIGYYQRLIRNEGRGEALRQVQLEMLKSKEYQNPYYWAAFIASGDWSSLK